ncbi:ABC-2 type transporter [Mycolicibacterium rhodesiae JS60]|nr:ABC-2 type transporter [Mycolicibacterium rhodesiae JS60]
MTTLDAPPGNSLVAESLIFAGRQLIHWRREPIVLVQALVLPAFLLVTYKLLVGKSILRITGTDSVYGLVPMCAIAGAMLGTFAAAGSLHIDRECGLLSRLWVLPVHRASALTGRLLAEALRTLVSTVLLTAVGILLGLRLSGGVLAAVLFVLVPVLIGAVFSMAVVAITMRTKTPGALVWLGVPATGAVFTSAGVPPPERFPEWMRPLTHVNPMTSVVDAMRQLALGEPAFWPLMTTVAWVAGVSVVLVPLAITGYRAAAVSRH